MYTEVEPTQCTDRLDVVVREKEETRMTSGVWA